MTTPSDSDPDDDGLFDEADSFSDAELALLRNALVQHGLRLGSLEAKLDQQMADLSAVRDVVRQTHNRMRTIAKKLGIDDDK